MTEPQTNGRSRRVILRTTSHQISPEALARIQAEREAAYQKAMAIFKAVRPQLINDYYNWYITIECDTGEYFIEKDYMTSFQRLRDRHSTDKTTTFRINETGVCGQI